MAGPRLDVIAAFTKAKATFFYKTMTASMVRDLSKWNVAALELPTLFASEHGEKMSQVVALIRPAAYGNGEWRLRFKGRYSARFPTRVFNFGGGWRDFVLDNGISVGEFLAFELVNGSTLLVHVYPRDDQLGLKPRSGEEESDLLNPGSGKNVDLKDRGQTRPPLNLEYIGFKKTLCASHGPHNKRTKLDIPASFWRSYGKEKFDKIVYTLEGPRMKLDVRASLEVREVQTKCAFCKGWRAFFIGNKLKLGDTVVFTLTGQYRFAVSVEA